MSRPSEAGADAPAKCPICGKPATQASHPFCSSRCANIDLGRWLKGSYRIPGAPSGPQAPGGPIQSPPEED